MENKPLIYLASPHHDKDWYVREMRYRLVMRAWMYFFKRGDLVLSPILHTHEVNLDHMPFEFYQALDERLILASDEVWIVCMEGWRSSRGIASEEKFARENEKPVRYWTFDYNAESGYPSEYLREILA